MEVISISSDSESSMSLEDLKIEKSISPPPLNDDYDIDWNDDAYSPINYKCSTANKAGNDSNLEEKIEEFVTPVRPDKKSKQDDMEIENADDKVDYLYDFKHCNLPESTKGYDLIVENLQKVTYSSSQGDIPLKSLTDRITRIQQTLSQEEKNIGKISKEQNKLEREKAKEKKKSEQLKQKALKAVLLENQKNLKPEENIKFLKVHIDNEIVNLPCGGNIISILQQNNIQYIVEPLLQNFTIMWSKKKTEKVVNDLGEITEKVEIRDEKELLYILDWQKAVTLVHSKELLSHVETIKSVYLDKNLTLIIYGIEKYFDYKKLKKNRDMKAEINDRRKVKLKECERVFEEAPSISKNELELALTEMQLLGKHNCRLLESPEELSGLVLNFTKSLSQIEYKLDKENRLSDNLGWFAKSDTNQCFKVDKKGNGLLKLWQQQICQFNAVGLETAQAIVSNYKSPLALVGQYNSCGSSEEGELLLQNIQIRRDAGILSSSRRVGPQLSKKIHKFFTSEDPNVEL